MDAIREEDASAYLQNRMDSDWFSENVSVGLLKYFDLVHCSEFKMEIWHIQMAAQHKRNKR
jgi:hypothetical protein